MIRKKTGWPLLKNGNNGYHKIQMKMSDENTITEMREQNLDILERQVERGHFFTHTALGVQAERINEIESFLYGIIDVLVKKGITVPEELQEAAAAVRK